MTTTVSLPVRLTDMQSVEQAYVAADPRERLEQHAELRFYQLLDVGERAALERRYPNELAGDPEATDAPEGVRVAWDFRCRELVVSLLRFGDEVLEARMDLVGAVEPGEDVAMLGLTVTGSVVDLSRPAANGDRRFIYRPSPRPDRGPRMGRATIKEAVRLGNRLQLGDLGTTELLVLAAGSTEAPERDATHEAPLFFAPDSDSVADAGVVDGFRIALTRFRVMVDALPETQRADAARTHERLVALAAELQAMIEPGGGLALQHVASFRSATAARYEVAAIRADGVDLVRHPHGVSAHATPLPNVDLGPQWVVVGAPLVLPYTAADGSRQIATVSRVTAVDPA